MEHPDSFFHPLPREWLRGVPRQSIPGVGVGGAGVAGVGGGWQLRYMQAPSRAQGPQLRLPRRARSTVSPRPLGATSACGSQGRPRSLPQNPEEIFQTRRF